MPLVQCPCLHHAYILRLSWPSWTTIVTRSSEMLTTLPLHYLTKNWLSWQDPNIIADIGARCLVYRNGMYQCHLPTFEGLLWVTWNNDRSFHTSVSTGMVFITVTCQPSKGCFEWRETTTEALRHQRQWPLASGLVLVETSIFSPKIMMVMICRSQVLTDDQRWSKFRLASYY